MKKLLLLLVAVFVISCNSNLKSSSLSDSTKSDSAKIVTDSASEKKSNQGSSSSLWNYENDTDKMTSKLKYFAAINSTNTLQFNAPYDGGSTATVTLRNQGGTNEIILTIDKGQFICDVSDGCTIKARFDNNQAIELSGSEPSDYSSTTLFIHPVSKFISRAKKAKKLIVEAQFYQEGVQDMEFDIAGLKWEH